MKRPWLIKAGGELLSRPDTRKRLAIHLKKVARTHSLVFVHGGGPQIEQELLRNKIPVRFVKGRRVTSPMAMTIVERILSGEINKEFTAQLSQYGLKAVGLSGRDNKMIIGTPLKGLGRAATPTTVDVVLIQTLLRDGFIPVVSTVGSDRAGRAVNINADDVASALAVKLKAERLIFLTNISGVLDGNKKRIAQLPLGQINTLIKSQIISGGMIPKVQGARAAIKKGVGEVDILLGTKGIDYRFGTRITC